MTGILKHAPDNALRAADQGYDDTLPLKRLHDDNVW